MKLNPRILMLGLTTTLIATHGDIHAQTVISGPNILTSTWSPAGSPYIVTADCTVPSGQTLTIQPGTIVWMGNGTSLIGNGIISAVGTVAQPITFQPPVSSQNWNTIIVKNTVGTNQFQYCDFSNAGNALDFRGASRNEIMDCIFSNAGTAIVLRDNSVNTVISCNFQDVTNGVWMTVGANNRTQTTEILNCGFTNCFSQSVYGEAYGNAGLSCSPGGCYAWSQQAWIVSTIRNCSFHSVGAGCRFNVWGTYFSQIQQPSATGYGYGNVRLLNNVFRDVTNTAGWFSVGNYAGGSQVTIFNTTIVNAGSGVVVQDPWDAKVQSGLFVGCTNAVKRSGTLSATVSYNGFFGNAANFIGYPATYGLPILVNRNGTLCDVLFNIFQDPQFVSATDFHLQAGSPCIDAGEGSGASFDSYFPPSMGSITNDIGAYGGPGAGQWNVPPPTNAFTLAIAKIPYVSVTVNPPEAGNYRLEYASALLGTNTWIQITNLPLTTLPFTYTEPATVPARYYRAVKQ